MRVLIVGLGIQGDAYSGPFAKVVMSTRRHPLKRCVSARGSTP